MVSQDLKTRRVEEGTELSIDMPVPGIPVLVHRKWEDPFIGPRQHLAYIYAEWSNIRLGECMLTRRNFNARKFREVLPEVCSFADHLVYASYEEASLAFWRSLGKNAR